MEEDTGSRLSEAEADSEATISDRTKRLIDRQQRQLAASSSLGPASNEELNRCFDQLNEGSESTITLPPSGSQQRQSDLDWYVARQERMAQQEETLHQKMLHLQREQFEQMRIDKERRHKEKREQLETMKTMEHERRMEEEKRKEEIQEDKAKRREELEELRRKEDREYRKL